MNKIYFLLLFVAFYNFSYSQTSIAVTTQDNTRGAWEDASSWVSSTRPAPLAVDIDDYPININGYITRENGGLSFAGGNTTVGRDFIINDTLVIMGDLHFANKSHNLKIPDGGLLIVFGDFSSDNKTNLEVGGVFVVTGFADFDPAHSDYSGSGKFFPLGGTNGNSSAAAAAAASGSLEDYNEDLYNFVGGGGGVLPVSVTSFLAEKRNRKVSLNWEVASEENFSFFSIERSGDGVNFEEIGTVEKTSEEGSKKYSYLDEAPLPGTAYYKLKSTDLDGNYKYHGIVSIKLFSPDIFTFYPHPVVAGELNYKIQLESVDKSAEIRISDLSGNLIHSSRAHSSNDKILLGKKIKPGIYLVELKSGMVLHRSKIVFQ